MEKGKKESNINLMLIGLIIVMLIASITIWGYILLRNQIEANNGSAPRKTVTRKSGKTSTSSNADDFDLSFLKLENVEKNSLYSPLSIKYALHMVKEGANGETLEEIEKVLGKEDSIKRYEDIDKVLSLANGIFVRDAFKNDVKKEYVETLKSRYNAELNYDSFNTPDNINKWIEGKTLGQIKDLVERISADTQVILVNALAIDMEWEQQFEKAATHGRDFNLANGNKMVATMMHRKSEDDSLYYYKDDEVSAITMPLKEYGGNKLSFIAIMPEDEKLKDYVDKFEIEDLNKIEEGMISAKKVSAGVELYIPKFEYDAGLDLKDDLVALGIKTAFTGNADFSGMAEDENLFISNAIHQATIEFSEKGTKAAAATVMTFDVVSINKNKEDEPVVLNFDKPFLYFIKDAESGDIWFVGTLYEPNKWENEKSNYGF